jgi:hypothetical protein
MYLAQKVLSLGFLNKTLRHYICLHGCSNTSVNFLLNSISTVQYLLYKNTDTSILSAPALPIITSHCCLYLHHIYIVLSPAVLFNIFCLLKNVFSDIKLKSSTDLYIVLYIIFIYMWICSFYEKSNVSIILKSKSQMLLSWPLRIMFKTVPTL